MRRLKQPTRQEWDIVTLERRLPAFRRVSVYLEGMRCPVEVSRTDLLLKLRLLPDDRKLDKVLIRTQGHELWVTFVEGQ